MSNLYAYALVLPGRDPLYLPGTTKPARVGYPRNITINQPPGTEVTFLTGDGRRQIDPLTLTGEITLADLGGWTEEDARLYLERLDNAAPLATAVQRGQTVVRQLRQGGWFTFEPVNMNRWTFTLTLFPAGPSWIDTPTGREIPF